MAVSRPFFIVGCARSGTTLMRVMLDAHPRLTVPQESHFVVSHAPAHTDAPPPSDVLEGIMQTHQFVRWGLAPSVVRERVAAEPPRSYGELIGRLYTTYADEHGKVRWGDKTPGYVNHIAMLAHVFPTAQFIHMIRDGRGVASSLSERQWGTRNAIQGAWLWRDEVRRGHRAGLQLASDGYLEVHLEDLVADLEPQLQRVCAFLGEPFDAGMLEYASRPGAHAAVRSPDHGNLTKPLSADLRDWRAKLTVAEQRAIEAICGPTLAALGYDAPARSIPGVLVAGRERIRQRAGRAWHQLHRRGAQS